jgi:asparagine synthase (glutamine-hydrolysing)
MCGFAALVRLDKAEADREAVARMAAAISHRGPDDSGSYFEGPVGLGFRRLSILDLTPTGHQPMATADGRFVIVFNGEIYNYVELRRELSALGYRFRSTGDTETLLYAYAHWGPDCLPKLNGMWAFVIYDRPARKLFGSRDRFGIKPLYRYQSGGVAMFASEIKAIRASDLYRGNINWTVAGDFLLRGRLDQTGDSFYRDICSVPPGAAFELGLDGHYREWRFWSLDALPSTEVRDPAEAFAECFEDAVRVHMRSDVAVGVDLSGGLDSTSIICSSARLRAAERATGPLMAFCYQAPEFDESTYIRDTLKQTGATIVNLETSPESLWDDLSSMLWYQDEPVHSMTPLIGYQLMRLTARHGLKVILNGQGADETIGGYPSYFRDYWYTLLRTGRMPEAWREVGEYARAHGENRFRLVLAQLRHLLQTRMRSMAAYRSTVRWVEWHRLRATNPWFDGDLLRTLQRDARDRKPDLDSVLREAVEVSPLPLYLRVEDRNSMAHSVEVRLPFLDYRLVTLLFKLAPEWHLRGPWNKFVLREAMRGRIPESVRSRLDKMGFPLPEQEWLANQLSEPVMDILRSRGARERGIYNLDVILRDAERHRRGAINVTSGLFDVAQFELWCGHAARSASNAPPGLPTVRVVSGKAASGA